MTDHPQPKHAGDDPADEEAKRQLLEVWREPTGWWRLSAVNNTVIGRWYLAVALGFFVYAGVLALIMRTQLAVPDNNLLSAQLYNQIFTMHGTAMMFLFAIPVFEAAAIILMPEILGARDLPFPRLSAFGFWCFVIGGVFVSGSLFWGAAPAGGWFMYAPLSSDPDQTGIGSDIWLLGLSFIEVAAIAAAVEIIVGVLKSRPVGMRINLMPLYGWYALVVAGMILFAFPPLIAGDLLLEMERAFDWPFFDATRGGSPLLWQHLFWIFGHPEVYIIFLPSFGLLAMIGPTFARRPVVGHSWIVLSAIGVAFLSFGLWVHHMFTTGLPEISLGFFAAASEAVAIPTAIQIFCLIATVLLGRTVGSVPMLYAFGALAIFVFGGLTGVMVAVVPFDFQAHDSYFVVAHLHYTLIGGMLFPVIGAIYYWYPLLKGKMLSDRLGRIGFWLAFGGFNIAFLPMHWTGVLGMPRRVWTYPEDAGWGTLNMVSTAGAYILALGIAVIAVDLLRPKGNEPRAPRNPWNAGTMEWSNEVPSMPWGVRSIPEITTRYPLWQQKGIVEEMDRGEWYLAGAAEGKRELIVTDILDARPMFVQRVPGPSYLPLTAAIFLGATFILATWHLWAWAALTFTVFTVVTLWWLWTDTARVPEKPEKDCGRGLILPLYASGEASVGWWGMFITMLGDSAAFAGLVFAYGFFWTIGSTPPPGTPMPLPAPLVGAAVCVALSWGATLAATGQNRAGRTGISATIMTCAALMAIASALALAWSCWAAGLDPTRHAFEATLWVLVLWVGVHCALGAVMQAYCLAALVAGKATPHHDADLRNTLLFWHFNALQALIVVGLLAAAPLVGGGGP